MAEPPKSTTARPRHTTVAAGLIIGSSALAVLGVVDQLGALHSLATRQTLEDFLRNPPGSGLGLDLSAARSALRGVLMVVAGCATAALVLGFGVLRRDHRARLVLTLLAVPLFLGGLMTGGIWTSVVASASVVLWLGPSGDWFAGRTPTPTRSRTETPSRTGSRPQGDPQAGNQTGSQTGTQTGSQTGQPLTPQPPAGGHEESPAPGPASWPAPPAYTRPWTPTAPVRRRPTAVVTACVLAWSLSGLVIGLMSLTLGAVLASPDMLWREALRQQPQLAEQGLGRGEVFAAAQALGVVGIVWSIAAIILAALVFRGSNGARIALAVSGYAAATLCLLGTLSSPVMLLPLVVCAASASLLLRPESRAWCRSPRP